MSTQLACGDCSEIWGLLELELLLCLTYLKHIYNCFLRPWTIIIDKNVSD